MVTSFMKLWIIVLFALIGGAYVIAYIGSLLYHLLKPQQKISSKTSHYSLSKVKYIGKK